MNTLDMLDLCRQYADFDHCTRDLLRNVIRGDVDEQDQREQRSRLFDIQRLFTEAVRVGVDGANLYVKDLEKLLGH